MIVLGMSSGTSRDGIDVAAVDFAVAGPDGGRPGIVGRLLHRATEDYPGEAADALERAATEPTTTWAEVCRVDTLVGQAFAAAAARAVAQVGPVGGVCSHGQTLHHWVEDHRARGTLQMGNPAWIAEAVDAPVVSDVRSRDLAAGGQGAPLVPVLDLLVLADVPGRPAALNLGGIANITVPRATGDGEAIAYDTGPANSLVDAAVRLRGAHPRGFDVGGAIAASGRVDEVLLGGLLAHPYLSAPPPKSTGPEEFGAGMLRRLLASAPGMSTPDVLATLTAFTARTVAAELRRWGVTRVFASGGGVRNDHLMSALHGELPGMTIEPSDVLGLPCDAKEAIAFALIGWLTLHGLPANVPSCTGAAGPRVLGVVTPGPVPLHLQPEPAPPRWLRMEVATGAR